MSGVRIDSSELMKLNKQFDSVINDMNKFNVNLASLAGPKILKYLKTVTPKDTGETADDWNINNKSNNGFSIINGRGGIVEFLMQGVKPHKIEPKDKSVLKASIGNSVIFAKFVDHPGYSKQMDKNRVFKRIVKIITDESVSITTKNLKKNLT